jgi:hypothetical protein
VRLWAATLLGAVLASACAGSPARIESRALRNAAPEPAERFIIAAVDNPTPDLVTHAGSTPRGYEALGAYGPGASARKVMRALEDEYGLREVNAWPIEPLHVHCAVLRLPEGADRAALLETLSRDKRIRLAQPLQAFATRSGGYNDPYLELQRGFWQMRVDEAHPWSRGEGVRVAIIDTGVDTPLLTGLISEGLRRGILSVGAASVEAADGQRGLLHKAGVIELRSSQAPPAGGFALYAPGRDIVTPLPGGHYDFASGDSIATAQVTGVVALLLEKNHALSTAAAMKLSHDTSAPADTARGGAGHVDACAASVALMGRGTCMDADPDSRLAEKRGILGTLH